MRTLPTSPLARCPVDGVPLLLITYRGVVVAGCELCDHVVFYAPRKRQLAWSQNGQPARPSPPRAVAPPTCYAEAVRAYALRAPHNVS